MVRAKAFKWNEEKDKFLKDNIARGYLFLSRHFEVKEVVCRRRAFKLGITVNRHQREKDIKDGKVKEKLGSTAEKFDKGRHKILNSSTVGKIPLWIESERMTVYISPGTDPQSVIDKFKNRKVSF